MHGFSFPLKINSPIKKRHQLQSHKTPSTRIETKETWIWRKFQHRFFPLPRKLIRRKIKRIQERTPINFCFQRKNIHISFPPHRRSFTAFPKLSVYFTLLVVACDVTGRIALVGFSNARIMSWWRSIFFLWSALLAVWKTLSSPISFRSFKVSSFTICIVGASVDLSSFFNPSALFERLFEPAFSTAEVEFVSLEVPWLSSRSRLRDGKHPIMPSLKHSRI